jgi:hypothetical protein
MAYGDSVSLESSELIELKASFLAGLNRDQSD